MRDGPSPTIWRTGKRPSTERPKFTTGKGGEQRKSRGAEQRFLFTMPWGNYSGLPPAETSGTSYVTADHLGSTRVVSDTGGAAKKCYDYLPFGEQIPSSSGGRSSRRCYAAADALR